MNEHRTALAALILTTLQGYQKRFRISTRLRAALIQGASKEDRDKVMGDPVHFCLLLHTGTQYLSGTEDALDREGDVEYTFDVQLWHRWRDHDNEEYASESEWDALYNTGLLELLKTTEWIESAECQLGTPQNIVTNIVPMDGGTKDLCHYGAFTITTRSYG